MYNENAFVRALITVLKGEGIETDKIHLQKFAAFISDNDINTPFRFLIHIYGPFSRELEAVLNTMTLWDDLRYNDYQGYSVSDDSVIKELKEAEIEYMRRLVKKFAAVLPNHDFSTLELYGTLYYYMHRTKPLSQDKVFEKFRYVKEDKFDVSDLNSAYNKLLTFF